MIARLDSINDDALDMLAELGPWETHLSGGPEIDIEVLVPSGADLKRSEACQLVKARRFLSPARSRLGLVNSSLAPINQDRFWQIGCEMMLLWVEFAAYQSTDAERQVHV